MISMKKFTELSTIKLPKSILHIIDADTVMEYCLWISNLYNIKKSFLDLVKEAEAIITVNWKTDEIRAIYDKELESAKKYLVDSIASAAKELKGYIFPEVVSGEEFALCLIIGKTSSAYSNKFTKQELYDICTENLEISSDGHIEYIGQYSNSYPSGDSNKYVNKIEFRPSKTHENVVEMVTTVEDIVKPAKKDVMSCKTLWYNIASRKTK